MRDCKERHMLDIRIVLRGISHNMVNIVIALPPAHRKSANIICDENCEHGIDLVVMCDANMASIMSSENQLMPHQTQAQATQRVLAIFQAYQRATEKSQVSAAFYSICGLACNHVALVNESLIQRPILCNNMGLRCRIGLRIFFHVQTDVLTC